MIAQEVSALSRKLADVGARLLVPDTTPEVDDLRAPMIGTAGAAEFPTSSEVVGKRLAYGLEATTDVSLYTV